GNRACRAYWRMAAIGRAWCARPPTAADRCGAGGCSLANLRIWRMGPEGWSRRSYSVAGSIGLSSMRHPHAGTLPPRQDFVAGIGHLGQIVDEGQADAADAGLADERKLFGDTIGRADERVAADRVGGEVAAFLVVFLGADRLRRDALIGEHAVNRLPIDILDIDVAVITLGFRLRRPADHLPYGEDLDLAAELCRGRLHFGNLGGIAGERCARACGGDEKSIAIAQCECLADVGRASIHQERPRFA